MQKWLSWITAMRLDAVLVKKVMPRKYCRDWVTTQSKHELSTGIQVEKKSHCIFGVLWCHVIMHSAFITILWVLIAPVLTKSEDEWKSHTHTISFCFLFLSDTELTTLHPKKTVPTIYWTDKRLVICCCNNIQSLSSIGSMCCNNNLSKGRVLNCINLKISWEKDTCKACEICDSPSLNKGPSNTARAILCLLKCLIIIFLDVKDNGNLWPKFYCVFSNSKK